MTCGRFLLASLVLAACVTGPASAHQTSLSYVGVSRGEEGLQARIKMAFLDLEVAVGVDADFDGKITWGETKAGLDRISTYASSRTRIRAGGDCSLARTSAAPSIENGESYLTLEFAMTCPRPEADASVTSTLFLDIDPTSRVLVNIRTGAENRTFVLGRGGEPGQ
jgi:hypothetical protein